MKKITILLLAMLFGFSITAQNIDEILRSHYKVMGYDQMKEINSMIFSGKTIRQGMENEYTMTMLRSDRYRLEVPIQGQ